MKKKIRIYLLIAIVVTLSISILSILFLNRPTDKLFGLLVSGKREKIFEINSIDSNYIKAVEIYTSTGSIVSVHRLPNNLLLVQEDEINPDIDKFAEGYYAAVEKNFKELYGNNYILDRESIDKPIIESNCNPNRSIFMLMDGQNPKSSIYKIDIGVNIVPSEAAVSVISNNGNVFLLAVTCMSIDSSANELQLNVYKLNLKDKKFEIEKENILSNTDMVYSVDDKAFVRTNNDWFEISINEFGQLIIDKTENIPTNEPKLVEDSTGNRFSLLH